jgi:hypothetical protein
VDLIRITEQEVLYDASDAKGALMYKHSRLLVLLAATFLALAFSGWMIGRADDTLGKETILQASDTSAKLIPETVFFRGQTAATQLRNSGGVHFSDGMYVLAALVDSSGYSTAIKEKYQGYLLTEVALEFGGQKLQPGAYGFGFVNGGKFVAMDLGAHDLFQIASQRDAELKRPVPLHFARGSAEGTYRLYAGRDFVEFHRGN